MLRCWLLCTLLATSGCGLILDLEDPEVGTSQPLQPGIKAIVPAADAVDVDRVAPLTVTFTTAMDPSTLDGDALILKTAAGDLVDAALAYDEETKTLSLQPSAPLTMRGAFTATLASHLRTDDGQYLGEATT